MWYGGYCGKGGEENPPYPEPFFGVGGRRKKEPGNKGGLAFWGFAFWGLAFFLYSSFAFSSSSFINLLIHLSFVTYTHTVFWRQLW